VFIPTSIYGRPVRSRLEWWIQLDEQFAYALGVARSKLEVSIPWLLFNLASPNPVYEPKQHAKPVVNFAKNFRLFGDLPWPSPNFVLSALASSTLMKENLKQSLSHEFWCQQNSGARKALVPEKLWCQQSSGVSKILVPEKLWCQKGSGARKALVSAKFWCQQNSGTRKVLVPERLWCQKSSGVSKVLVSAKFWYQKSSGARKALVPEKLWCQQSSGVRQNPGARKALVPEKLWCQQKF
jgi:hypothetical protein